MHTNLCIASLLVYNRRARTKETFAGFIVHLRVVAMVITVALSTIKVVFPCQRTLIQPCQVGFLSTFFVLILSKHTCCCFVTVNLTAWDSTFKVQIEHSSARGFINNSSTRATGFHREVKLFALNFCIAICPEPSFPRKPCLGKHNCFQG